MSGTVCPRIAIVMAVHNRRDLTVQSVRSLLPQRNDADLSLVMYDDGSTDGTEEAVYQLWPDAEIIFGDGTAFWNGGMHHAWQRATELGAQAYLWLNDDVELDPNAISRLVHEWKSHNQPVILVGATRNSAGDISYGALRVVPDRLRFRVEKMPACDFAAHADTLNGNFVLIDSGVVDRIGLNDPNFFHSAGDIDYGLRASKAGIPILAMPGTVGVCEMNLNSQLHRLSFRERWRRLNSHLGPRPSTWWRLVRRHSGIWAPLHFTTAYLRYFFPNYFGRGDH